ncbi:MAG: protein kinase [Pyrinomonadaceae bacterium]
MMTKCPECSADITDDDVFCPFCGITQKPLVPDGEFDESFESTIMMGPPAKLAEEPSNPTQEQASPDIPSTAELNASTSENVIISSIPDISDADLSDVFGTANNVVSGDVGRDSEVTPLPQPPEETPVKFESVPEFPLITPEILANQDSDLDPENKGQPEKTSAVEDTAEPQPEPEGQSSSIISTSEKIADPDAATEPSIPVDGSTEPSIPVGELENVDVESPVEKNVEPNPEGIADRISKPLVELEEIDKFASQSMFDSVQIIDSKNADIKGMGLPIATPLGDPAPQISLEADTILGTQSEKLVRDVPASQGSGRSGTGGRMTAKLKPLTEGIVLNGRYEVIRKIGGGGMGAVYLASDNNLGGVLRAIKEMVQSYIEEVQQDKAIDDFRRESMILSSLDHPSIPTIYDYFYDEAESRFYLVMKYISGGDLSAKLRSAPEGRLDEKTVTDWGLQIADVLDYLHNQPTTIVYRDLKPSNIMIDGNSGRVMLIDFGIARSIGQKEEKGVTAVGTMGYAPPELFSGSVEPRSDIYSLGSTMFHLLTGADPQSNPLLIFDFQKNPRPRQINPQLSDQMEKFLMRCVEYNASSRYSSAAELRGFLEDHSINLTCGKVTYGINEIPVSVSLANQSVFCGFCGQRIVATDLFCAFCGAKQPIAQQGVHSEIYSNRTITANLIIEGTSELSDPIYSLEKPENLIGRRDPMSNIFPEVDLSKYDPQTKISRRHARIWRDGNSFLVEDLGSSNGTILLAAVSDALRLMPHKPHNLNAGDKIKVGDTTLHFVLG